ncbi:MliC family protein [Bartonella sp. CB189]|uniref:MliC family protein n=1 Tax=Bartonella sp. CB189 TaxID=3112254 RepID=UPI002F96DCE3
MKKTSFIMQFFVALSLLLSSSIGAFSGSLIIEVPDDPEPTTETIAYQCDLGKVKERVEVTYLNAGDISLVDFMWNGRRIVGSNVLSASGSKYVGDAYIWWISKNEATLYDLINDPNEEKPILCVEEKDNAVK